MKKPVALILLSVLCLLMANNVVFRHVHMLADGSCVVHAHPFTSENDHGKDGQNHRHTGLELIFLDSIYHFERVLVIPALTCFVNLKFEQQYVANLIFHFRSNLKISGYLRAPPSVSF